MFQVTSSVKPLLRSNIPKPNNIPRNRGFLDARVGASFRHWTTYCGHISRHWRALFQNGQISLLWYGVVNGILPSNAMFAHAVAVNKMLLARNEIETSVYFDGVWMVPWRCLSQSWWLLTVWQKLTSALRMPNSRQDKLRPGVSAKHAQTVIPRQKASWSTSYGGEKNQHGHNMTCVLL